MKVDIQNSKIELVKVDNQWVAQANQNVSFIPQSENTLLIQTQNQTIQVTLVGELLLSWLFDVSAYQGLMSE